MAGMDGLGEASSAFAASVSGGHTASLITQQPQWTARDSHRAMHLHLVATTANQVRSTERRLISLGRSDLGGEVTSPIGLPPFAEHAPPYVDTPPPTPRPCSSPLHPTPPNPRHPPPLSFNGIPPHLLVYPTLSPLPLNSFPRGLLHASTTPGGQAVRRGGSLSPLLLHHFASQCCPLHNLWSKSRARFEVDPSSMELTDRWKVTELLGSARRSCDREGQREDRAREARRTSTFDALIAWNRPVCLSPIQPVSIPHFPHLLAPVHQHVCSTFYFYYIHPPKDPGEEWVA